MTARHEYGEYGVPVEPEAGDDDSDECESACDCGGTGGGDDGGDENTHDDKVTFVALEGFSPSDLTAEQRDEIEDSLAMEFLLHGFQLSGVQIASEDAPIVRIDSTYTDTDS